MNLQIARPLAFSQTMNHYDESQQTYIADDYANMTFEESAIARPLTNSPDRSRAAPIVTHTLRSGGADAGEDGTGRGTPIIVAGHDTGQGWWNESDIAGTLRSEGENRPSRPSNIVAFSSKDHGADAGEISPTLRSQNFRDSHMNGGGQVAIAFDWQAGAGGDDESFRGKSRSYIVRKGEYAQLRSSARDAVQGNFGVRRLTPRECERLQSFPDDFTRWDADGKEISDSARYRMLGNAVCVNVAHWIGKRILETRAALPLGLLEAA